MISNQYIKQHRFFISCVGGSIIAIMCNMMMGWYGFNRDESWLFLAAIRLLQGGNTLKDFMEPSTPISILLYTPGAALHLATNWSWEHCNNLNISTMVGGIGTICANQLLRVHPDSGTKIFLFIILTISFGLLLDPYNIGQKDQMAFLLCTPYILCLYGRCVQKKIKGSSTTIISASLGSWIKGPFFILLPFFLTHQHDSRKDWCIFGISSILYLSLTAPWQMEWSWMMIHNQEIYAAYRANWMYLLFSNTGWILLAILLCMTIHKTPQDRPIVKIAIGTILGSLLLVFIQGKGWQYHYSPTKMILVALSIIALNNAYKYKKYASFQSGIIGLCYLMIIHPLYHHPSEIYYKLESNKQIQSSAHYQTLSTLNNNDSWVALGIEHIHFPLASMLDAKWGSRFPYLWQLLWVFYEQQKVDPDRKKISTVQWNVGNDVAEDLRRWRPRIVLIQDEENKNILSMLKTNPKFFQQWNQYQEQKNTIFNGSYFNYKIFVRNPSTAE